MIIVSISGPRMSDALAQVASSAPYADMLEFRLDMIRSPELVVLLLSTRKPVIVACRPAWEGGSFRGTETRRLGILSAASLLGADYIDIELGAGREALARFIGRRQETRVIVSHHLTPGRRVDLRALYRKMRRTGADVIKFAFFAGDANENRIAFDFLRLAHADAQKAVAIAMGEAGEPSRILYRVFGGWATYAATEDGRETAPGQVPASLLKELYRADRLSSRTKIFGVVGNPVRQSKGVYVHNPLFARSGKNAVYCRFRVTDLRLFVRRMAPLLQGFSVTHPHKSKMLRYVGTLDSIARAIGAVNTVVRRGKGLWGTNTDAPGALDAIERLICVAGRRILIIGAGGAARAIAYEAVRRGARVSVTNRTAARGKSLAREFGIEFVPGRDAAKKDFEILVNATPIGMVPHTHESPFPARALRGKIVFDAVYNPPMTRLLREALRAGARIIRGTDMYVNQAARQFRLYAGVEPDLRMIRKLMSGQS